MTEHFIEFEGKKYTPLEFAEFAADNLQDKRKAVIDVYERSIATTDENIKGFRKLIEVTEGHDTDNQIPKYKASLDEQLKKRTETQRFLNMIKGLKGVTEAVAKAAKKEVDDLK